MADKPFPENEAGINSLLQGLAVKLPTHQATLALSAADVDFIIKGAANYQYLINTTPQVTDSKESFTKLKDTYFNGLNNSIAPSMTVFPIIAVPNTKTLGIVPETKAIIKRIKASAGYTEAIGEDLGLVDTGNNLVVSELTASLKVKALSDSRVEVVFSKQGQDAMRVEFRRKGEDWSLADVFTASPGIHDVASIPPDEPETRDYRGTLIRKNAEVGTTSPTYTVVTTP